MENKEKEGREMDARTLKTEDLRETADVWYYDLRKLGRERQAHACTKSELARQYMPRATSAAARRKMRDWIEKNPEMKEALLKNGYTDRGVLLTPVQVQIHYDFLGLP